MAGECKSEEAWQEEEEEESSSELDDEEEEEEEEHRQNSEAEEEENGDEEVEEEEEGEHTQDSANDHMAVFTPTCLHECLSNITLKDTICRNSVSHMITTQKVSVRFIRSPVATSTMNEIKTHGVTQHYLNPTKLCNVIKISYSVFLMSFSGFFHEMHQCSSYYSILRSVSVRCN